MRLRMAEIGRNIFLMFYTLMFTFNLENEDWSKLMLKMIKNFKSYPSQD